MALADYINNKPTIETPRLRIRPLCKADVPALKEWMPDKTIYKYWGKGPGKTDKKPELLFEKEERPCKSFHLGVEEKTSGKVIGDLWVYLIENDRMASVAIRLAPVRQGMGFGTEALSAMTRFCFANTELKRLWAEVQAHASDIETRLDDTFCTIGSLKADNRAFREGFEESGEQILLIESDFLQTVDSLLGWNTWGLKPSSEKASTHPGKLSMSALIMARGRVYP